MTAEEFIHLEYQKAYSQTKPGETYPVYPTDYLFPLIQEYARIKCLEAIKNTRHRCIEVLEQNSYYDEISNYKNRDMVKTISEIQNIPNQDVMPEL